MAKIQGELLRGNIDTIILKCLFEGDKYGNEICKAVEERTLGQFEIKQPTLYSCLTRLENQGLVTCTWVNTNNGGRRKYFSMTPAGRDFFAQKQKDWEFSRTVVDKLISEQIFDLSTGETEYRARERQPGAEAGETDVPAREVLPPAAPEAEIAVTTVGPPIETQPAPADADRPDAVTKPAPLSPAEQEIAATVVVPERKESQSAPPAAAEGAAAARLSRALGGASYYDHLSRQTYTPPVRHGENYFRFEAEEEDGDETAPDILTRTEQDRNPASPPPVPSVSRPAETLSRTEPGREPLTPEEFRVREGARSVLYAADAGDAFDNLQNVSEQQRQTSSLRRPAQPLEEAPADAGDYKAALAAIFAAPESAPEEPATPSPVSVPAKEKLANGLTLRRHSRELTREYQQKFYVFGNRLRLWQNVILAVVILLETLGCYLAIGIGAQVKTDIWLYYAAAILAAVLPIYAAGAYLIQPLKIQRIDEEKKNYLLFRVILALQAIVLIVCVEILVDKSVLNDIAYLNRIVLPTVLATNLALSAGIGQILIKTGRFAVK